MSSPKEILKNKLAFLETETDRANDINNVGYHRTRAHTLGPSGSYHPAKKNLWTEWLLYFNAAKKNETVDKNELKELLTEYKNIFEKFRVSKCPPISQQIEGSPCTIVSKTLSILNDEYDLNYSRIPPLIELASIKVPAEDFEAVSSEMMIDPRAAQARRGGKKRKTKKRKKSKKVRKKKRKTRKGGAQTAAEEPTSTPSAAEEPTTIPSLTAQAAKKINNKKDLQYANRLQLRDEEVQGEIERKLKWIKQQEDARRASEHNRKQYDNLRLQNQAPSVAYSNRVIGRPRVKKVENKTKKPAVSKNPKKNPPV